MSDNVILTEACKCDEPGDRSIITTKVMSDGNDWEKVKTVIVQKGQSDRVFVCNPDIRVVVVTTMLLTVPHGSSCSDESKAVM